MKKKVGLLLGVLFSIFLSMKAFAGQWIDQSGNRFYMRDDNTCRFELKSCKCNPSENLTKHNKVTYKIIKSIVEDIKSV